MNTQELTKIIEDAKAGDHQAKDTIIRIMQENSYIKLINRYLYMNRLLEPDDVKAEFWMGVILALPKVKPDIGDPLFYLAWEGKNRVRNQLRKKIGKGVQFTCLSCGWVGRLYRKEHEYKCRKCGSTEFETHQKEVSMTILISNEEEASPLDIFIQSKPEQLEVDIKIDNDYIKTKLTTQEVRVFTLIIENQIDQGHEQNYLKTIGSILNISAQCVGQYVKNIRRKLIQIRQEMK